MAHEELVVASLSSCLPSFEMASSETDPSLWSKAGIFLGVPTDDNAATVYWRKRDPTPPVIDPDGDGCGVL